MIGVGKVKQYSNVLDKPLSKGKQEVPPPPLSFYIIPNSSCLVSEKHSKKVKDADINQKAAFCFSGLLF